MKDFESKTDNAERYRNPPLHPFFHAIFLLQFTCGHSQILGNFDGNFPHERNGKPNRDSDDVEEEMTKSDNQTVAYVVAG